MFHAGRRRRKSSANVFLALFLSESGASYACNRTTHGIAAAFPGCNESIADDLRYMEEIDKAKRLKRSDIPPAAWQKARELKNVLWNV